MEEELFMTKLFSIPEFEEMVFTFFDQSQLRQNSELQISGDAA
jgi:hypothetical protein